MGQREAWGGLGEICQEYLQKGSLIYPEGRLKTDKYDDNSTTKFFSKVIAVGMQFLDKKDKEEPVLNTEEEASDYEA